jgi:hypothetical protein
MALISSGFSDWKNAVRALAQHNGSRFHSECLYVIQQQSKPSVITRIDIVARQQQEQRRRLLMVEVSSLQYLLRQGIAIRGHNEEDGNLFQLMRLRSIDIPGLDQWLIDKKYLSHDIINELAKEMSLIILRNICLEVNLKVELYVVYADVYMYFRFPNDHFFLLFVMNQLMNQGKCN